MDSIKSFRGSNEFLSNMYPCWAWLDGVSYPSVEHAFQAAKTLDLEKRRLFQVCPVKAAKKEGRLVDLRPDWEKVKLDIMYSLLKSKFSDAELKQKLLETGDKQLIEGNTWNDTYWGVCKGVGENHLGKLLMQVRSELREEDQKGEF